MQGETAVVMINTVFNEQTEQKGEGSYCVNFIRLCIWRWIFISLETCIFDLKISSEKCSALSLWTKKKQ